jgi:mgtE-like transporter
MEFLRTFLARLVRSLGPDPRAVVQTVVALLVSVIVTLLAGLTLASSEERLAELPGLLLMVPAAIAQRGNVFGAMGSRLGTAIHTGTFSITTRPDTLFAQNVLASLGLSVMAATWLAFVARGLASVFDIAGAMSLLDFVAVSVSGGLIASIVVLAITVALAAGSTRFGWDLDNVTAPLVTATGDLVTLPALIIGSLVVGSGRGSEVLGVISIAAAIAALVLCLRAGLPLLRRIVLESIPVLGTASFLSLIAGILIEKQLGSFLEQPALLILVPAYFGMAGALGGILSSRLGTKVHLGLVQSTAWPQREALLDMRSIALLAVPIFALVGLAAHLGSVVVGAESPGFVMMVAVASLAGVGATLVVVAVAYYGTLAAVRFGLDPDTAAIPLTNSMLDLVGAFTLVGTIVLLGVGT